MSKKTNPRWKNKPKKTKYTSVYELIADDSTKQYIVRFSYLGTNYGERNFSNIFGVRTAKQAFDKLQEVKVEIAKYGNNPFEKKIKSTLNAYYKEHIKTLKNKTKYGEKYSYMKTYEKYILDTIGHKDIDEIKRSHIEKILDTDMKGLSNRRKLDIKNILKPLLGKAIKNSLIKYSPLEDIKFDKTSNKKEITYRIITDLEEAGQELYRDIMFLENIEDKIILLIALMTARRKGEILQLEYSYIKDDKVFVPEGIAKTKNTDEFPLPIEVLKLLPKLKSYKIKGKLFTGKAYRATPVFNKVVKNSNIEFTEGNTMTLHDTRNLFASIMSPITNNPPLVDRCLSHAQTNMMTRYMSFGYATRKEVFEEYWEIIRGNKASK